MLALGIFIGITGNAGAGVRAWILSTGFWRDNAFWRDSAVWRD